VHLSLLAESASMDDWSKKASSKIEPEDNVELSEGIDFVSRAGHKLAHALREFAIVPEGLCLDAGASTGGFTQVLIENGAEKSFG